MKAILTDYSHWSSARKLGYMSECPDKYYIICSTDDSNLNNSNFAIFDVSELSGIGSGDGETIVSLKDRKDSIYCDGVAFFEDGDDIKERYIDSLKECGYEFEVKEIREVNVAEKREELERRSKSVKSKIKAIAKEMLMNGSIVPSDISADSPSTFESTEDEILCLGSFIYNGVSGMLEYVSKKLAISPDSVRMFNVMNYEFPFVAICIKGDLLKKEHFSDISRRIEKCLNCVSCYRPPRDYSYTDIDFIWDDVEFKFTEPEEAYFIIYHYRPDKEFDVESEKKNIDIAMADGLTLEAKDDNIEINMPMGVHTKAGAELMKLISEYLNENIVLPQNNEYSIERIRIISKEIFFKITQHYSYESSEFLYRRRQ